MSRFKEVMSEIDLVKSSTNVINSMYLQSAESHNLLLKLQLFVVLRRLQANELNGEDKSRVGRNNISEATGT